MTTKEIRSYPPESSWNLDPTAEQINSMNRALRRLKRPEVTEMNRPATRWQARDAQKELWDEVKDGPRVKAAAIKHNSEHKKMENNKVIKCECISGLLNRRLQYAVEDKINDEKNKLEHGTEHIKNYPAMAKRADDIVRDDPQYQKGLVSARDIYGDWGGTNLVMAELKESIKKHEELLSMLKAIPNCEE
uniref:Uncharacterized protein n=1 Tax=viral metagenome TaxID=1070528 RepID=A0A6M3MD32_9ZZZZ